MTLDEMINNSNISQKLSDIANRDGMSREDRGVVYFCAKYFKDNYEYMHENILDDLKEIANKVDKLSKSKENKNAMQKCIDDLKNYLRKAGGAGITDRTCYVLECLNKCRLGSWDVESCRKNKTLGTATIFDYIDFSFLKNGLIGEDNYAK